MEVGIASFVDYVGVCTITTVRLSQRCVSLAVLDTFCKTMIFILNLNPTSSNF